MEGCEFAGTQTKVLLLAVMASKDIAGMHLFFEMKRIFPELSEDIIRKTIHKWPNDCMQCIHHLKKEREKCQFHKQSFSEYLTSSHVNRKNYCYTSDMKLQQDVRDSVETAPICKTGMQNYYSLKKVPEEAKCENSKLSEKMIFVNSHQLWPNFAFNDINTQTQVFSSVNQKKKDCSSRTLNLPSKLQQENTFVKTTSLSGSESKHMSCHQVKSNTASKQHQVKSNTASKQHKVTLSFIPSPPCSQRTILPESTICASASRISSSRQHVTSIHLELQPDIPNMPSVKISAAANNVSTVSPKSKQNYDSCIHISFTSLGATFSAQRTKFSSEISLHDNREKNLDNSETMLPNSTAARNISGYSSLPLYKSIIPENHCEKSDCVSMLNTQPFPEVKNNIIRTFIPHFHSKNHSTNPKTHNLGNNNNLDECITQGNLPNKNRNNIQPYVQAVLHHQKLRLEILKKEYERDKAMFWQISNEVNEMEQSLKPKQNKVPNITELKEGNEKLKEDCRKLFYELRKIQKFEEIYAQKS